MKNKRKQMRRILNAALSAALLLCAAGCIVITIKDERGRTDDERSGGAFVPVQGPAVSDGSTTVCGQTVSGTKVLFQFDSNGESLPYQIPPPGKTGFRGYVLDLNTGQTLANTDYLLQYFVNVAINGCCTTVAGSTTDVRCGVTAGLPYRFTAFFKTGHVPPTGHQLRLQGTWKP